MGCPLCAADAAPSTYTVRVGDTLSAIVLKLGMCVKDNGPTGGWLPCLAVAEKVARLNGIPWSGPPTWSAPISPGMVLRVDIGSRSGIPIWAKLLGVGVLAVVVTKVKAPAKKAPAKR